MKRTLDGRRYLRIQSKFSVTCERRVSREALTLAPKLNPMAVGLGLGLPLLGGDLIFYKQESMHTHSIKHSCVRCLSNVAWF
jgi:hypothetical protein